MDLFRMFNFDEELFRQELEKMPGGVIKVLAKHGPEALCAVDWGDPWWFAVDPWISGWFSWNLWESLMGFLWIFVGEIPMGFLPYYGIPNVQLIPLIQGFQLSPFFRSCCVPLHLQWMPGICWRWLWRLKRCTNLSAKHDQVIPSCSTWCFVSWTEVTEAIVFGILIILVSSSKSSWTILCTCQAGLGVEEENAQVGLAWPAAEKHIMEIWKGIPFTSFNQQAIISHSDGLDRCNIVATWTGMIAPLGLTLTPVTGLIGGSFVKNNRDCDQLPT